MKKLVIIGTQDKNTNILKTLALNNQYFNEVILLNHEDDPKLETYKESIISKFKHQKLSFLLKFSTDEQALLNSDYVLISLDEGQCDQNIDSNNPVILSHFQATRLVPIILDWMDKIKALAEFACVINVTEPVGIITEAVCRYGDFSNFVSLNGNYEEMKSNINELFNDTYKDLILNVAGLYEDAYVINVFNRKNDILDKVIDQVEKYNNEQGSNCKFIKHLGLIPCQGKTLNLPFIEQLNQNDVGASILNYIDSIENDLRGYQVVNISNRGHILDLPQNCAIEVTARITKGGAKPLHIGHLPTQIRGSIQHLKAYEELLVDGIYENNPDKIKLALVLHPQLSKSETVQLIHKI